MMPDAASLLAYASGGFIAAGITIAVIATVGLLRALRDERKRRDKR